MNRVIFLLGICCLALGAYAQEDNLSAGRPGQASPAATVGNGTLQIESGFAWEIVDDYIHNNTFNSTQLRYGLSDALEVYLGTDYLGYHKELEGGDIDKKGFGALMLGAKYMLYKGSDKLPKLSLAAAFKLPDTGSSSFKNDKLAADIRVCSDYALSSKVSLGVNAGLAWSGEELDNAATFLYAACFGFSLSENWSAFTELYGFFLNEGGSDHRLDAGFAFLVNPSLQFDLSAGLGLSEVSPEFFIGVGVAYRLWK